MIHSEMAGVHRIFRSNSLPFFAFYPPVIKHCNATYKLFVDDFPIEPAISNGFSIPGGYIHVYPHRSCHDAWITIFQPVDPCRSAFKICPESRTCRNSGPFRVRSNEFGIKPLNKGELWQEHIDQNILSIDIIHSVYHVLCYL